MIMPYAHRLKNGCAVLGLLLLAACSMLSEKAERDSGPRPGSVDVSSVPDAVPRAEPKSKCGNPQSYEVFGKRYKVLSSGQGFVEKGIASWYGKKFHGRKTSSCETYDMYAMTAAHKHLPLPTYVEVTNLDNGRKIVVRVNDRGPFHNNRVIDLSYTAADKLGMLSQGTALVEVRAIDPNSYKKGGAPVYSGGKYGQSQAGFYLQVGAFSNRQNAEQLKRRLNTLVPDIRISRAVVDGKQLYRVQIGPLLNVEAADGIVKSLADYGIWEHHITVN